MFVKFWQMEWANWRLVVIVSQTFRPKAFELADLDLPQITILRTPKLQNQLLTLDSILATFDDNLNPLLRINGRLWIITRKPLHYLAVFVEQ